MSRWTPGFLGVAVTLGFFGTLAYMLGRPIPEVGRDVLLVLVGALAAKFSDIVSYHFGSSAGSARKTELMQPPQGRDTP